MMYHVILRNFQFVICIPCEFVGFFFLYSKTCKDPLDLPRPHIQRHCHLPKKKLKTLLFSYTKIDFLKYKIL